jgi:hypothetical protein
LRKGGEVNPIDKINFIAERLIQALVFGICGFVLGLGLLKALEIFAAGEPLCP